MPRFGLGFRKRHFDELIARPPGIDWLELVSDHYLGVGGPRRAQLERLCETHPVALHGVGLGIANDRAPSRAYVSALRALASSVDPLFVSDHLCWTGRGGIETHDLLPVAATRKVLELVGQRVARVQDALGRRILLENASAYVRFARDEMSEIELLAELCDRTGCGVLLDVNNLVVNAANLGVDPYSAIAALGADQVGYLHVAGHAEIEGLRIDTHGEAVQASVWTVFEHAARRFPDAGVILERDDSIPPLADLIAELALAREHWTRAQHSLPDDVRPPRASKAPRVHVHEAPNPGTDRVPEQSWAVLQRRFFATVTRPCDDVKEIGPVAALDAGLDATVPVPCERGLRVYRDAFSSLYERVLAANFPALVRVLTQRDLRALCSAFARAHPPRTHEFVSLGRPLADFIEGFDLAERYAVPRGALADLARVEQAELEAQEAPDDDERLALDALVQLAPGDWPASRFTFGESLRVVATRWDVLPTLEAVRSGAKPPLPKRVDAGVLVLRSGSGMKIRRIERGAALGLVRLAAGEDFATAVMHAGGEVAAGPLARALASACCDGAIRRCVTTTRLLAEPEARR